MLEKISGSDDVKRLNDAELSELSDDIREFLVENVTATGGHLASNLGVVELTLALHRVFDFPKDKLIFDVGHQCYVHKILTGRKDGFSLLRKEGGISGFPKPSESVYDAFGTGHSSTAPSAGLGIASAAKLSGSDSYTVVVLGDGAATGGLIYEALNNCRCDLNYIVILNENEMSISKNVGNLSGIISKIRSSPEYFSLKDCLSDFIERIPLVGAPILKFLRRCKKLLKMYFYRFTFIEEMGLKYYGPIDGNDLKKTELLLKQAKKAGGSALIHLRTMKGKGYAPAELNPEKYHAVSSKSGSSACGMSFSAQAGKTLAGLGADMENLCAITAAMGEGTGLSCFFERFPERSFDVGIAEGHAVTFAAGLAAGGYVPVFAVYSSFLQRSYDNLIHDAAIQNLHIVLFIDRAGLSPDDGITHHGIWDVAFLSQMPGVSLYAPLSLGKEDEYIHEAVDGKGICAVRYPKGSELDFSEKLNRVGKYILTDVSEDELSECDIPVIVYGRISEEAVKAVDSARRNGVKTAVIVCEKLLPYSEVTDEVCTALNHIVSRAVIVEEGIRHGGFAVNMQSELSARREFEMSRFEILAIDEPPSHGELIKLYSRCGISADDILRAIFHAEENRK